MNPSYWLALICLLSPPLQSVAQTPSGGTVASGEQARGAAEASGQSRPASGDWWQESRDTAGRWWERSQDKAEDLWRQSLETADQAWDGTRSYLEPTPEDQFGKVWDQVLPTLEETLALEERHGQLPESAWFGEDQASNRQAINKLLDEAVAILSVSDVQHYRKRIRTLAEKTAEARRDIADYRRRRVSAPESAVVKRTVSDYDDAIAERQGDIQRYQEELARIREEFSADLREMGLELSDEQLEFLLSTVVGDNLIDLGIVFDNVKAITMQLEQLVKDSGEDLQSARRYYGMYVVLLQGLHLMHLQVEQAIAGKYVPEIDAIAARARDLTAETRALMRRSPDKRELLEANLEAQNLTIEAAGVYRDYLDQQGRQVTAARVELERDIAAAWNTYETVRVSGELVDLVKSSRRLLEGLLDRQVPALQPLQNLELKREFAKLTAQLRAAEGG